MLASSRAILLPPARGKAGMGVGPSRVPSSTASSNDFALCHARIEGVAALSGWRASTDAACRVTCRDLPGISSRSSWNSSKRYRCIRKSRLFDSASRDGAEVDFVLSAGQRLTHLIECKLADARPHRALRSFASRFPDARAMQLVRDLRQEEQRGTVRITDAAGCRSIAR